MARPHLEAAGVDIEGFLNELLDLLLVALGGKPVGRTVLVRIGFFPRSMRPKRPTDASLKLRA